MTAHSIIDMLTAVAAANGCELTDARPIVEPEIEHIQDVGGWCLLALLIVVPLLVALLAWLGAF